MSPQPDASGLVSEAAGHGRPEYASSEDGRALRAIVFDFDGLIIDSETTSLRSWQDLYTSYGQELPLESWITLIGTWDAAWDPRAELESRVGHALDWDSIEPDRMAREHELADAQPMLPGVERLLAEAAERGLALAVASSSSHRWVSHHLERLGIAERFSALATRYDVERTKPDPALYLLALERLGVSAGDAIAFEDSVNGVTAAAAAGIPVVAVPGPLMHGQDFSRADLILGSLAEAPMARILELLGRP